MKTETIEVSVVEPMQGKNGVYLKEYKKLEEIPDDGRHSILCSKCGWPSYPKCREWCPNEKSNKKKRTKIEES